MINKTGLPAGRQVEFSVVKETLRGSLFVPSGKGPFPGVVFYHGRGSDRTRYLPMAKKLSENGIIGFAFDFRGCGKSDGKFKDQSHQMGIENAKAGLEYLLTQNVDKTRVGIQGTSFGGYVTGMLLNNYDFIKSVVLRVPAAYDDKDLPIMPEEFPEYVYFQKKENWINSSAYKGINKFKGKLLVIRSEFDEVIPEEAVNKYYEDAKNASERKLYVQKGARHSFKIDSKGLFLFHKIVVDWFLETL